MVDVARLRIEIDDVEPRVVRRVEVPLSIRLDDLHFVLQIAIGWQNCHPFEFRVGDEAWGLVDRDADDNPLPAEQATLADLAVRTSSFKYNYTFGDDWQHSVEIEATASAEADGRHPKLLTAEGRCPPADVGGPSGYELYLRAIGDPRDAQHEAMLEWGDADFDPHVADIATLRGNLANLAKYLGRRKTEPH
jgi:pRiA4b ORF-3-like protein